MNLSPTHRLPYMECAHTLLYAVMHRMLNYLCTMQYKGSKVADNHRNLQRVP